MYSVAIPAPPLVQTNAMRSSALALAEMKCVAIVMDVVIEVGMEDSTTAAEFAEEGEEEGDEGLAKLIEGDVAEFTNPFWKVKEEFFDGCVELIGEGREHGGG